MREREAKITLFPIWLFHFTLSIRLTSIPLANERDSKGANGFFSTTVVSSELVDAINRSHWSLCIQPQHHFPARDFVTRSTDRRIISELNQFLQNPKWISIGNGHGCVARRLRFICHRSAWDWLIGRSMSHRQSMNIYWLTTDQAKPRFLFSVIRNLSINFQAIVTAHHKCYTCSKHLWL